MARPKKPNHPVTVRLEQELYDRLNDFCERSGQPKTVAIERALKAYIDDYDEMMEKVNSHDAVMKTE
ncbi:MAG: ribbon-helix-helix protein, CopG family [Oliverpabstia sp.]|uniref:ribbon-helix-helix domain-containing protein n=1 Tax=Blautia sp. TaxID=1955243 RepID=UPI002670F531|nr:ribbon-helix-helix domain-containing protein [uncultured Blautia sp.]